MRKLKVAAIQAASVAIDINERWNGVDVPHALDLLEKANDLGADIACFPELYPMLGEAELKEKARQFGIWVIAGLAQGTPDSWYNTSTIISSAGKIVGRQTKNYPTAGEVEAGVVAGSSFEVFETELGRFGIVICADFAFFNDGVAICRGQKADIIFNPAVWFALSEAFPHTVAGRHMEYSVPIIGVNQARSYKSGLGAQFPPAGGFTTVCVPPPTITDLDTLWDWFRTKPSGIDSASDFIHTLGPHEEIYIADIDIDAVRQFPGYFSTRET